MKAAPATLLMEAIAFIQYLGLLSLAATAAGGLGYCACLVATVGCEAGGRMRAAQIAPFPAQAHILDRIGLVLLAFRAGLKRPLKPMGLHLVPVTRIQTSGPAY